jgi:phage terminase large subunit-like protein
MWSEMTLSPNKWGNSQRWIDTYAGIKGESPILEQLYEAGVEQGRRVWDDLEVYANDAAKMLTVWVTKPMFDWQSEAYYAEQAATLTPSEFARMHRNQWAASFNAFIPIEWWDSCQRPLEPTRDKHSIVIGIDAAVSNDCFAVVAVSTAMRDGVKHAEVRYCKTWKPPPGGQIQFAEPEAEIRRLMQQYNVVCITYDPMQMADMVQRMAGLAWWYKFDQGKPRAIADKRLYDMIRDRHIEHAGEVDLREHLIHAIRRDEDGDKLRIDKREAAKKIDAVIALSMAVDRAMSLTM